MGSDSLSDFFDERDDNHDQLVDMSTNLAEEDYFLSIFDSLQGVSEFPTIDDHDEGGAVHDVCSKEGGEMLTACLVSQKSASSSGFLQESSETDDHELETSRKKKRLKTSSINYGVCSSDQELVSSDGQQKISHITVERNRRKQMNEHLSVLRSLMPSFYVKRGDQASIIGGVVDYINELQQVLQSLEAKQQRKIVYNEILSPRLNLQISPRPSSSPRSSKPPLSPRLINLPISPRTPQPSTGPYKPPRLHHGLNLSPAMANLLDQPSPSNTSKSEIAEVEVKFSGPNVLLKTVSAKIRGQAVKIISALDHLSLEILHVKISAVDETMLYSFTIKIGIECQLSAEELANEIQQTFFQVQ